MSEYLTYAIDWTLSQSAFHDLVRNMIHEAHKKDKVLALPINVEPGQTFIDLLTLLLARIDCEGCRAPCCRQNPAGLPTQLLASEYRRLSEKYGKENFVIKDSAVYLPIPCPFLRSSRCSIYEERPFVCVLYPFQFGGSASTPDGAPVMALASRCPASRKLTRDVFMTAWQLRRQFRLLGDKDFWKGFD
jgi:Fe-S-cluster containining protein